MQCSQVDVLAMYIPRTRRAATSLYCFDVISSVSLKTTCDCDVIGVRDANDALTTVTISRQIILDWKLISYLLRQRKMNSAKWTS